MKEKGRREREGGQEGNNSRWDIFLANQHVGCRVCDSQTEGVRTNKLPSLSSFSLLFLCVALAGMGAHVNSGIPPARQKVSRGKQCQNLTVDHKIQSVDFHFYFHRLCLAGPEISRKLCDAPMYCIHCDVKSYISQKKKKNHIIRHVV